ncbi:autoinducer binding domain-containing protein [Variovorax sp. ZT4R33]|uniref:autoinducer binding domain-containing protein n=1 Tax=Variovorax sp. ZT4R33 TaxID=3443743 RepID=UPI003F451691
MRPFFEMLATRLAAARTVEDVGNVIGYGARELGFEHWAYGLRLPLPFTRPRFMMVSNYQDQWVERYQEQGYISIDPTVLHGSRTPVPQVWSARTFAPAPQLWDEAQSFGLRIGWAQSCFDGNGRIGMLSLVRSHEKLSERERRAKDPFWRWLANVAHLELSNRLLLSRPDSEVSLTARQIEVLRWTADGKTSAQVAQILNVSEHTVHFHVKNAIARLGAGNKLAAAARATRLGLLDR